MNQRSSLKKKNSPEIFAEVDTRSEERKKSGG
jgi:hypothetical protein